MTKFKTKLLVALISSILIILLAVGLLLGQLFKSYYITTFNERIQEETILLSQYIEEKGGITEFSRAETEELANLLDANFSILNPDGSVYFESSEGEMNAAKQHQAFLSGILNDLETEQEGFEMIEGESDLHYYWKVIELNGETNGIVVLSNEIEAIQQVNSKMWWILITCLGTTLVLISMLGNQIAIRYTEPIEAATATAIELANGNYRARTYEKGTDETGMLSASLNILARNLQEMEITREMYQDRLETLIENIGSGVLQIDHRGYITLVNKAYKELFNVQNSEILYKLYYEVITHQEIIELIEEIFITEKSIKRKVRIPFSIERKHFEVYGAPIIGNSDEWKGILVVFHDITELKKLEQMRKDFVANVSHELKTPITSIKGFSETLLDGAMKDEKTLQHFLTIILNESDRLQALIEDLLDLSKIEQKKFVLTTNPVDLSSILKETVEMLQQKADEKNISLNMTVAKSPLMIEGDPYRVKQIFINLITNALTYTLSNGTIHVEVQEQTDRFSVSITDTGIGIDKKELPRIFERFYRIDKARSRNSGGTGLGLAIVKHIIEIHKGKITVDSVPGEGTTFTVELLKKIS